MSEMSVQEVIAILQRAREHYSNKYIREAFNMAIEVLKETERNPTITSWYDFDRGYNIAKEEFSKLHGEWIIKRDKKGKSYGECSRCGMKNYAGATMYCPDCGALMKGEK